MTHDDTSDRHDPRGSPAKSKDPSVDSAAHAYPKDLASLVLSRWPEMQPEAELDLRLPEPAQLEEILSICYQASLLREEGRPVTFRVAFGAPHFFPASGGPPAGLHRVVFRESRSFDQHELRRLAPAAIFSRSLVGAIAEPAGARIWGVIHSGAQWLQSVRGGRETEQAIPPVLIVAVAGPGRVLVSAGTTTIAKLTHGTLVSRGIDVFQATWLEDFLAPIGGNHSAAQEGDQRSLDSRAAVDERFRAVLASHVLRRVLATVRSAQHGGMLIMVPEHRANEVLEDERYLRLKYAFLDEEPRQRIRTLTTAIMSELATRHPGESVGWKEYERSDARQLIESDEALFEAAQLISDLTHVDGAVVMTTGLDVLGFGGEIAGDLPEVPRVTRARDLEGTARESVRTDRVGTRHRSAYRLCNVLRDALALVVSQDGGLRFVRWQDGAVTYWEQVATAPWEV